MQVSKLELKPSRFSQRATFASILNPQKIDMMTVALGKLNEALATASGKALACALIAWLGASIVHRRGVGDYNYPEISVLTTC